MSDSGQRCWWCGEVPDYVAYHDAEWGFPVEDDRRLFEKLTLEGFQSGLSWLTILRKRGNFRAAFDGFDFEAIARYDAGEVDRLMTDAGIVRHRGKIEAAIGNARLACDLVDEVGSIAAYVWRFEPDPASRPVRLTRELASTMTTSPESHALSKDLRKRGWRFVGPTTMYAFMQAMGLVNDHMHDCPTRRAVERARVAFRRPG
jgi:DNA-3-methyladenine glycosylase I